MKKLMHILFFLSLLLLTAFPQDKIHRGVIQERITPERLRDMHKANAYDLQEVNNIESLLLKSISGNSQTVLKNPQREFYEEEGFTTKVTRGTINKTLLGNGFLLIEDILKTWGGSGWVDSSKTSYIYDGNNKRTEELNQTWNGSAWVNEWKYLYTYDTNNNQTEVLIQHWDSSVWVNFAKFSFTYDGNYNRTEYLNQWWDGSAWFYYENFLYTYDGNNNLIEELHLTWEGTGSKSSYTYDGNNNRTEALIQTWDGSAWKNDSKVSYNYDGNNNQTEALGQDWDGSAWVNFVKFSFTYNGYNDLTEWLMQFWNSSVWENDRKYLYTYDTNNSQTKALEQVPDGSAWENYFQDLYTFDGNNNRIEDLGQSWDGSAWVNSSKYSCTYIPVTTVNEDLSSVKSYNLSSNYPNPFNPSTTIKFSIPTSEFVTLKVYDVLGNELATLVNEEKPTGSYEVEFNAAGFSSGIYFYTINAGSFIETKKMILLK